MKHLRSIVGALKVVKQNVICKCNSISAEVRILMFKVDFFQIFSKFAVNIFPEESVKSAHPN